MIPPLLPYYYPTTAIFIDDNEFFLGNLRQILPIALPHRLFVSPQTAMRYFSALRIEQHADDRWFSEYADNPDPATSRVISIQLDSIARQAYDATRFGRVSVAVVNLDMPGINGLDICKALRGTPIKTILLTATAKLKIGIDAFNAGLIDAFVPKGEKDTLEKLPQVVLDLQHEFFERETRVLTHTLGGQEYGFLKDADVTAEFERHIQERRIVEYYLLSDPKGFFTLTEAGEGFYFLLFDAEDLFGLADISQAYGASEEIASSIRNGKLLPIISWDKEAEAPNQGVLRKLIDGRPVGEGARYFVGEVSASAFDIIKQSEIAPLQGYLEEQYAGGLNFIRD